MFVNYRGSIFNLLGWQWKNVALFLGGGLLAALVHHYAAGFLPKLSAIPIGIMGGAIGIFVSFRTNSAYQRWWEGRQLWGRLINNSRHFATQALVYLDQQPEAARALVRRQIAYTHLLRCRLRDQDALADADVKEFLSAEELAALEGDSSQAHALMHIQMQTLFKLARQGIINPEILRSFDETIRTFLDVQGGCERIKKTPFPRGYTFISDRLIMALGLLLPWGLLHDMGFWAVPLSVLVCLSFALIGEAGRVLEDPFTMFWPALPLSALSKTIEINLRQRLGEAGLPPLPVPNARGILM
jgi:ion channel-forming bestrophin family protein